MASPEIICAKITAFLATLAPAIFGALISLRFIPADIGAINRLVSYLSGVAIANYMGGGIAAYFHQSGMVATSIIFSFGVFGLTIVSHLWVEIPKAIAVARVKWLGGE